MAWARVAATDENFHPLIGIDIECFDVDTMVPISVVATDLGGIALFTALPENQRYFFKARILRTSTRVQSILYPDQGRTYTGMVRLQILNQHPGMTCFDALVDPTGHVGSHTTIQAAIDAYNLPSTYRPWNIGVLPKATAYSENLVFTSTRRYVLQPACAPSNVMDWTGGGESSVDAGGLACPIAIQGPSAAAATIGTTGAGTGQLELRGVWVKNSGYTNSLNVSYLNLRLIDCQISGGTGTSAGLYLGTVSSVEIHRCIIGDSTTGKSVNMTLAVYLRAVDTVFIGWVDLSSQLGAVLQNCVVRVSRSGSGTCAILINTAQDQSNFRILGGSLFQSDAAGHGIRVEGGVGEDFDVIISNMYMRGSGGGTAVRFVNSAGEEAATVTGNIFDNWSKGVDADGCDNIIVVGNAYPNTTTPTSGGGGTGTVLESVHTLLDGAFHSDTLLGVVVDGDVIIGNVTPKWSRLAISIPAANIRNVLGIDNGELRPSWKAALSAANPSTISEGASASSGTSLLFSQQDHVHGAPATWTPSAHTHTIAHNDLTGVTADQHHAGFVGLIIAGPANIDPDAGDRITIEDSASVTWASSGAGKIAATAVAGGVDHGGLSGLLDDDHTQYLLLAGRAAAQQDIAKSISVATYMRVGSAVAPTNVTAGDLTTVRLHVGDDDAFPTESVLRLVRTFTPTTGGARNVVDVEVISAPGAGDPADAVHAMDFYVYVRPTANAAGQHSGIHGMAHHDAGNFDLTNTFRSLAGVVGVAVQDVVGTTAQNVIGGSFYYRAGAGTIAYAYGVTVHKGIVGDAGAISSAIGLLINSSYGVTPTTDIGIRVDAQLTAALWLNTDTAASGVIAWGLTRDVTLYRTAAGQLIVVGTGDSIIWVGDTNFGLNFAGGSPIIALDSNDFWQYVRATNTLTFYIGGAAQFEFSAGLASFPRGSLVVGTDDAIRGDLTLYGNGAGAAQGGVARLYLSADYDGTFHYWGIDVYEDDLRFYSSDGAVVNVMTAAGQLQLPITGSAGGLLLGGDADLYRGAANVLYSSDSLRVAGHARIGGTAAPTNTTAGDLTAVRALVGTDAAIEATAVLDVEGGTLLYGRAKVTDDSASKAVGTDTGLSVFHIPAIVAGSWYEEQVMVEARPTGASSAVYVGQRLYSQTQAGNANNYSANPALVASQAIVQHLGGGTLAYMYGKYIQVIMGAAAGAITGAAYGIVQSFVSSSAAAIAEVRGIYLLTPTLGAGTLTNYYGIYIANSTVAATLNIGIRVEGMNQAALWLSSDTASRNVIAWGSARDVNLYREGANILCTDDKLHVVGELEVDGALNHDGATVGFFGVAPAAWAAAYTPTNVTPDRSYDANATSVDELADVLGTLIADLQSYGLLQ